MAQYKIILNSFYLIFITKFINKFFKYLKILKLLKKKNISVINIPKKKKLFTVLRSPHIYKRSKEQFELIFYKKIIFIEFKKIKENKQNLKIFKFYKYLNIYKNKQFFPLEIKIEEKKNF